MLLQSYLIQFMLHECPRKVPKPRSNYDQNMRLLLGLKLLRKSLDACTKESCLTRRPLLSVDPPNIEPSTSHTVPGSGSVPSRK